jgi:hypothetical protein
MSTQPNAEPILTVEQFRNVMGPAMGMLTLDRFCEILGCERDDYAAQKFQDLQQIALNISRFDPQTLQRLVEAQLARTT